MGEDQIKVDPTINVPPIVLATPAKSKIDLKLVTIEDKKSNSLLASDDSNFDLKDRYSTGLHSIDIIMGGGHFAGRLYSFSAEKSSGKSSLLDSMRGYFQNFYGGVCIHAESEATIDMTRAMLMGVDPELMIINKNPITVTEEGFEWLESTMLQFRKIYPDAPAMLSWDTIEATYPRDVYNASGGEKMDKAIDQYAGGRQLKPRIIKMQMPRFTELITKLRAFAIFVNQVYDGGGQYGDTLIAPGGHGLNHHITCHLRFYRQASIYNNETQKLPIGINVKLKTIKNKQAPEHLEVEIPLFYSTGFCDELGVFRLAQKYGLIKVAGNGWCSGFDSFGKPVSLRTSEMGTKGERIKNTPFFNWMAAGLYRFFGHHYPSLSERYSAIADDLEAEGLQWLSEGRPIIHDKSVTIEQPFVYR
jgi:RecA/RadA recombinase